MERRTWMKAFLGTSAAVGLGAVGLVALRHRAAPANANTGKAEVPLIQVHKSATCGCCKEWVGHLEQNGFKVEVFELDNLEPVKARLGVPPGKGSCHTGEVDGYLVEGHVPAVDIHRLLAERPKARGLVLPGMPIGSPGMEVEGTPAQAFTVELVKLDGETEPFAHHPASLQTARSS
jgi:hypothetical protein